MQQVEGNGGSDKKSDGSDVPLGSPPFENQHIISIRSVDWFESEIVVFEKMIYSARIWSVERSWKIQFSLSLEL